MARFSDKHRKRTLILKTVLAIFVIFFGAITCRLFFIELYKVPSVSMENRIFPGDYLIVNKFHYGALVPGSLSEIPWINLLFSPADEVLPAYRLPGFSKIKNNDIVVFKHQGSLHKIIVKRCIAIPGDTLSVINGIAEVNNHFIDTASTIRLRYYTALKNINLKIPDDERQVMKQKRYLSTAQMIELKNDSQAYCNTIYDTIGKNSVWYSKQLNWSVDEIGPIIMPQKGMTIDLNSEMQAKYDHILLKYEGIKKFSNGKYYFKNKAIKFWKMRFNYYFFMGDNRHNSLDSRFFGFIPEYLIIGKATVL